MTHIIGKFRLVGWVVKLNNIGMDEALLHGQPLVRSEQEESANGLSSGRRSSPPLNHIYRMGIAGGDH